MVLQRGRTRESAESELGKPVLGFIRSFNEAALVRVRRVGKAGGRKSGPRSFNEAALVRVRRGRTTRWTPIGRTCFNEAALVRVRREVEDDVAALETEASTRPHS